MSLQLPSGYNPMHPRYTWYIHKRQNHDYKNPVARLLKNLIHALGTRNSEYSVSLLRLPQSELTVLSESGDEVLVRVVHYPNNIFLVNLDGQIEREGNKTETSPHKGITIPQH